MRVIFTIQPTIFFLVFQNKKPSQINIAQTVGDQNSPFETDISVKTQWRPTCLWSPIGILTHIFKYIYFYLLFANLYKLE